MSHDINRYLEIMRRTGLPVIVATGEGEPVVVMPLDAYETLLEPSGAHMNPVATQAPVQEPLPASVPPPNPANLPAYDPMEEQQEMQKNPVKSRKSPMASQSAEDRFFLESVE